MAVISISCFNDAERDNPLDPKSPLYKDSAVISGFVLSFYPPHTPIQGAKVSVHPENRSAFTDASGKFILSNLPAGKFTLIAEKNQFAPDSATMQIYSGIESKQNFYLDGLPQFEQFEIISIHISRWFPQPYDQFFFETTAKIVDADGESDIKEVLLLDENFVTLDTLNFQNSTNAFHSIIDMTDTADVIGNFVGQQFYLKALDKAGHENISEPFYMKRIILATPVIIEPTSLQSVTPTPILKWQLPALNFFYKLQVQIFPTDFPTLQPVWSMSDIPMDSTTVLVTDSLAQGNYFWTVSIIDQFGDWSRSKEGSFQVQ